MKKHKYVIGIFFIFLLIGFWYVRTLLHIPEALPIQGQMVRPIDTQEKKGVVYNDMIKLTSPTQNTQLSSPLVVTGEARGSWFFEASFPVSIVNWDGLILAQGTATAQGDWMTEEYVPFTAELTFPSPYKVGDPDFMRNGALILKKDNPSGLPQFDDAFEIPIEFAPQDTK